MNIVITIIIGLSLFILGLISAGKIKENYTGFIVGFIAPLLLMTLLITLMFEGSLNEDILMEEIQSEMIQKNIILENESVTPVVSYKKYGKNNSLEVIVGNKIYEIVRENGNIEKIIDTGKTAIQ